MVSSELVVDADAATVGLAAFVGDVTNYPVLSGLQPDLYRCFMAATWATARAEPWGCCIKRPTSRTRRPERYEPPPTLACVATGSL